MAAAEDWARGRGFDVLELDVATPNGGGRRLYERLGYVRSPSRWSSPSAVTRVTLTAGLSPARGSATARAGGRGPCGSRRRTRRCPPRPAASPRAAQSASSPSRWTPRTATSPGSSSARDRQPRERRLLAARIREQQDPLVADRDRRLDLRADRRGRERRRREVRDARVNRIERPRRRSWGRNPRARAGGCDAFVTREGVCNAASCIIGPCDGQRGQTADIEDRRAQGSTGGVQHGRPRGRRRDPDPDPGRPAAPAACSSSCLIFFLALQWLPSAVEGRPAAALTASGGQTGVLARHVGGPVQQRRHGRVHGRGRPTTPTTCGPTPSSASGQQYQCAGPSSCSPAQTVSGCGPASSETGPFFTARPTRRSTSTPDFFKELSDQFGAPGDFAQAYVIAHDLSLSANSLYVQLRRSTVCDFEL